MANTKFRTHEAYFRIKRINNSTDLVVLSVALPEFFIEAAYEIYV